MTTPRLRRPGNKREKTELDITEVEEKDKETRYICMYIHMPIYLPTYLKIGLNLNGERVLIIGG